MCSTTAPEAKEHARKRAKALAKANTKRFMLKNVSDK